jgi:putative transposase
MPQSLSSVLLHIVFSTKNREPFIGPEVEAQLYFYMATVFQGCESRALIIGGTSDHIHALADLARTITIADLIQEVKTQSSRWMKKQGRGLGGFQWQSGYGAFSIGQSGVNTVKAYIANQKAHHAKYTFQDEFRSLLKKYNISFDERYVWD